MGWQAVWDQAVQSNEGRSQEPRAREGRCHLVNIVLVTMEEGALGDKKRW